MALQDSSSFFQHIPVNRLDLQRDEVIVFCNETLSSWGLEGDSMIYVRTLLLAGVVAILTFGLWWLSRKIMIRIIHVFARRSATKFDDILIRNKFFAALAHLIPLIFMDSWVRTVFYSFPRLADFFSRVTVLVIIYAIMVVIMRFLNTARDVLKEKPIYADKPVEAYFQLSKIIVSGILIIMMISVALGVQLMEIFISLGAITAILLLVFKDTILGFVGSIQLAANDMIRIGDWVTMEKFGADGDVMEINLTTVKIKNFDLTITTIPTYSFISDSFKNWRGMQESDGRRVMRAMNIKMQSIKFCTPDMLNKLEEIELIRSYVSEKEKEIAEFNAQHSVNKKVLLNGRNQTNLGIFRYYVTQYLKNNPHINQNMTLMVRQLPSTEKGVPLQVYAFTKTKVWKDYEAIVSDIFDHLLASAQYFELEVFENPAGSDMRSLGSKSV